MFSRSFSEKWHIDLVLARKWGGMHFRPFADHEFS